MPAATKKAPAKKAAAAKKAPAKKAAPAKAAAKKATASSNGAAEAEARRAEKAKEDERLTKEVVRLRGMGENWEFIAGQLSISQGKAQMLMMFHEAGTKPGAGSKKPTAAQIESDRTKGGMSWTAIAAKYGSTKSEIQRIFRDGGKDPAASYIGKGGRYFGHEEKVAKAKKAANGSSSSSKPSRSESAAKAKAANSSLKPLFKTLGDKATITDKERDDFIAKVDGKVITWKSDGMSKGVDSARVAPGTVKVGKQKDGTRVAQFSADGKSRTVRVSDIVKVASK